MKKIMIVEDDPFLQKELKETLTSAGYEVVELTKFTNAKQDILDQSPDLLLLDINLPNLNGEILLKELREQTNFPIIMLTSRTGEIDEVLCMSYGADDYITKPYNPTILLLRINAIFKRLEHHQPFLKYHDITIIPAKSLMITPEKQEVLLTKNELMIFNYLLNNIGRIVPREELMTELWNNEEYINDNALTVTISRLRAKLKEIHLEEAIITRKGQGYILK